MSLYTKEDVEKQTGISADEMLARRKRMEECRKRVEALIMEDL